LSYAIASLPAQLPSQGPFVGSMDSGVVNVHEIVDEEDTFVHQFPCGDFHQFNISETESCSVLIQKFALPPKRDETSTQ
jgi:hypothetical protein